MKIYFGYSWTERKKFIFRSVWVDFLNRIEHFNWIDLLEITYANKKKSQFRDSLELFAVVFVFSSFAYSQFP